MEEGTYCTRNYFWKHHTAVSSMRFLLTSALNMVRGAFGDIDLLSAGITDCNKHTIDIHCPLFSESPTNISLLFLNFSHIFFTSHLF